MYMHVHCPACGAKLRVLEAMLGKDISCTACKRVFRCGSRTERNLQTHSVEVVRTAPVGVNDKPVSDQVHFRCTACHASLQSPKEKVGQKIQCPECGQRLQIPQTQTGAQVPVRVVGSVPPVSVVQSLRTEPEQEKDKSRGSGSRRRSHTGKQELNCLECGADISQRARVQTCPDCGTAFCSSRCYRQHRYYAHNSG